MADIISRMRLDSSEYDNKIRNAAKNLQSFEQECRKAGKSLNDVSDANVEYIQSLGRMETSAKSTKGKLGELSNAFTDLRAQYNRLTEEEKNGKYGQALSASLEQMKTRINDAKAELSGINAELGNTKEKSTDAGGSLAGLAEKFGLNIPKVTAMGVALGATTAAMKIATDAFFASESNVDEWGRTVEAGKSVYESFLHTLNSGDFGSFFRNLDGVISKARAAYDAIDELNTVMTIINPERARLQAQQTELKATIRRSGAESEAGKEAQRQLKALEPKLQQSYKEEARMNMNAFTTEVDRKLEAAGINLDNNSRNFLMRSFYDTDTYNRLKANARGGVSFTANTTPMYNTGGWAQANISKTDTRNINQKLLDLFTDEWRNQYSGYLTGAFGARNQAASMMLGDARYIRNTTTGGRGGGGGGGGTTSGRGGGGTANTPPPVGSIAEQEQKVQALTKAWKEATDQAGRDGYLAQLNEAKALLDEMQGKVKEVIPEGSLKDLKNQMSELQKQKELLTDPVDIINQERAIGELQEKIDRLNGKGGNITPNTMTAGESLIQSVRESIAEANIAADTAALTNTLEVIFQQGIDGIDINVDGVYEQIFGAGVPDEYWESLAAQVNEALKKAGAGLSIEIDPKTGNIVKKFAKEGKETGESWRAAAGAIQAVGNAMQGIENPTARIIGIIGEAIANIALGFSKQSLEAAGGGPVAWIAAIAGGLATMTSTIAAIKSATAGAYAEGGIIPGNRYHDELTANVSSGELILNRAQQGNLAAQLQGGEATGSGASRPYVSGETIFLGVNNYLRRSGKGELITTK